MLQQAGQHGSRTGQEQVTVRLRRAVGLLYIGGAVVHITLASFNARGYDAFADGALLDVVRSGWREIFMSDPSAWALLLAWGEAALGAALLLGGTAARWGYGGVIAFHVALMLFGWGFWTWSVPALVFLVWLARRDWPLLGQPRVPTTGDSRP